MVFSDTTISFITREAGPRLLNAKNGKGLVRVSREYFRFYDEANAVYARHRTFENLCTKFYSFIRCLDIAIGVTKHPDTMTYTGVVSPYVKRVTEFDEYISRCNLSGDQKERLDSYIKATTFYRDYEHMLAALKTNASLLMSLIEQ